MARPSIGHVPKFGLFALCRHGNSDRNAESMSKLACALSIKTPIDPIGCIFVELRGAYFFPELVMLKTRQDEKKSFI